MEYKNLNFSAWLFIFLAGLTAPLFLIPIEKLLPYPHIIEELAKLILVFFVLKYLNKNIRLLTIIISGLAFSLSESFFYLGSAYGAGYGFLWQKKLFLTLFIHLFTLLLFYFSSLKSKKSWLFIFWIAAFFHYWLNKLF